MKHTLLALLRSRKFLMAIFGVAQAIILHYYNVPDELWQATTGLIGVLIAAIAGEDIATKIGGAKVGG